MRRRSWDDDSHPHFAAYVEAWEQRRSTGRTHLSVLHDALARHGVGVPTSDGERLVRDLLDEEWTRGSSPRRLRWRMAARAGRIVWGSVSSVVQLLRHDGENPGPAWAVAPDGVLLISDVALGLSVEVDRTMRVDDAGRAVVRRIVDTSRPFLGSHVCDVWLRVRDDTSADVLAGPDVVGTVDLTDGDADRMRAAELHRVHADGALHLRGPDDGAPTVQLWLPPPGPVLWPGLLAWSAEDDEDD